MSNQKNTIHTATIGTSVIRFWDGTKAGPRQNAAVNAPAAFRSTLAAVK